MAAINKPTLSAANDYTDDGFAAHVAAVDPHSAAGYMRAVDGNGVSIPNFVIIRRAKGAPLPMPPPAHGLAIGPDGIFSPNETGTGWVQLGQGGIAVDTTPPSVPTNLRVTGTTPTTITLAWDASTDSETGVGGYDVARDSGTPIPLGDVRTYTYTGLTPLTSYALKVDARDQATPPNVSAAGTLVATTTALPLSAPQNLRVTASTTTSLTFAWDAPTQGTPTSYQWRVASGAFASNGTAMTKTVTGLTPNTPYQFGLEAVYPSGASSEVTLTATTTASTGTIGSMYVGIHVVQPTASPGGDIANNPPLSIYAGMSQLQVLQKVEADMETLTGFPGPLMTIGHAFMAVGSGYKPTSWASTQLAQSTLPAMILNFKPTAGESVSGFAQTVNGGDDAAIKSMIAALPAGKRIYLVYDHEPADPINDSPTDAFFAGWRAAQVHWANLIIANRGGKDLHPTLCLTTYSFRPAAASQQAKYLSVTDDYEAAGIDWQTQVVFGADGYQQKVTGPNPTGSVKNVASSATNTYIDIYPQLKAAGWKRLGITETACCDRVGTSSSFSITATDVTQAPVWVKSLVKYAAANSMEYVCWFNATGSMGPLGTWMYTDAVKTAWGQAGHYRGPAPGW